MAKHIAELARADVIAASELVPTALTGGELSGLFRPLREVMGLEKVEDRLGCLLDQLDVIKQTALTRQRTVKNGIIVFDPDCNAAVKCLEVAARLMGLEKAPALPKGSGIAMAAVFPARNED
jgi:hypothetical protein